MQAASTAPSGAHTQPWHFAVVTSPAVKAELRAIVEVWRVAQQCVLFSILFSIAVQDEERINYERRMGQDWVEDLQRFKTSWSKPYLDVGRWGTVPVEFNRLTTAVVLCSARHSGGNSLPLQHGCRWQ